MKAALMIYIYYHNPHKADEGLMKTAFCQTNHYFV